MELQNDPKTYKLGLTAGLLSGLFWGLSTVLSDGVLSIFVAPLVVAFLNYLFSTVWLVIYMAVRGEIKSTFKALNTKSGRAVVLASLFGGPFGFGCYLLAVNFIGAGYAASISAVFPVLTGLFSFIFLKEKLKLKNWVGLLISIAAIAFLWFTSGETADNFALGLILAVGSAVGWALESVICAWGMKGDEVGSEQALFIRKMVAALAYGALIIPFIGGFGMSLNVATSHIGLFMAGIALIGTLSYGLYYKAIDMVGPSRGTGLNVTYAAWAVVFGLLLGDGTEISWVLITCIVLISFGTFLVSRK